MGTDIPPNPPSTPKHKALTIVGDTPAQKSQISNQFRENVGLERCRLALVDDLGHSLEQVALSYFDDDVLPPLPSGLDIDAITRKLVTDGALHESFISTDNGKLECKRRWSAFPANFDDWKKLKEDKTYVFLKDVIQSITDAAVAVSTDFRPRMEYKTQPTEDMLMVYDSESGSSKPDGYFVLCGLPERATGRRYWHEVAVPGEYKLSEAPKVACQNRQQTCWNMYQQLRQDPRRRFSLAFTIEKTTTRLWFCNRSKAFVSEPFDFLCEDYKTWIRFVLRIIAAEEHQLGWDTSMVQRPLETVDTPITRDNLMYDMEVHGEQGGIFRTVKLLNDVGARMIRGRGTRVWKTRKVARIGEEDEPSGPYFALKDAWVDADRSREPQILKDLKSSGTGKAFQCVVQNHLLSVECSGDVLVEGKLDHTLDLHTNGQRLPLTRCRIMIPLVEATVPGVETHSGTNAVSRRERKRLAAFTLDHPSGTENTKSFHDKQHQRTVFVEVAESLYGQNKPEDVFNALSQIVLALKQFHQAGNGWVHRDISAGNILIASDGMAKLVDLEYMKELTDKNAHEVRTGTAYFIACEADTRKYLYICKPKEDTDERPSKKARLMEPSDDEHDSDKEGDSESEDEFFGLLANAYNRSAAVQKVEPQSLNYGLVFFHNALHDLESILWIAIYFLFDKEPVSSGDGAVLWTRGEQQKIAAGLFYTLHGRKLMMSSEDWNECVKVLHPDCQAAAMHLGKMRDLLIERYKKLESKLPLELGRKVGGNLYKEFSVLLNMASVAIEGVVVRDLPRIALI